MNAHLLIGSLLVGFAFYSAYSMDGYTPTKQERIDAALRFMEEDFPGIISPEIILPTLSGRQWAMLSPQEQAFVEEREQILDILRGIATQKSEEVENTTIDLLYQYLTWAIGRANLGWNVDRRELNDPSVITTAALKEKMDTIRAVKPIPFTMTDLKEKEIRTHDAGKNDVRLKAERPPLPPHSWRDLHKRLVSSASSAYCGPEKSKKLTSCEIPEQEEQE